ncbi:AAA family ATPase [Sorangium sp. So ce117]|uniref:AAA family ATPase n=1 Tax=Sorangium sp. So ce117 TaxID=3133277 RepID=UPI003F639C53
MTRPATILFLGANPSDTTRLALDQEMREIDKRLRASAGRDTFRVEQAWSVRAADLQESLLRYRPTIVHFCGHGSPAGELLFEDEQGLSKPMPTAALAQLFGILGRKIRCVVLNACYSEVQAITISEHIDCVIGMTTAVGDKSAIAFAGAFYQALGYGEDIETAFYLGRLQVDLTGLSDADALKLRVRPGVQAGKTWLVKSNDEPPPTFPPAGGEGGRHGGAIHDASQIHPADPASQSIAGCPSPDARLASRLSDVVTSKTSSPGRPLQRKGENRVCTVMIVDISVVALSTRLDPSEVRDLLDRCHRAIAEPIEALGGYVNRLGGNAAIGVFGARSASESDAERAVLAASQLPAALAQIRMPKGARGSRPSARIGISTGRVFAEVTAGAAAGGLNVIGEPVIEAGALQQAAALGTIVIDRDTRRLIAWRFSVEPLPPVAVAGQHERIPAFRVIGPLPFQHGLSPKDFHGLDTKLFGRGVELQRLLDLLESVAQERRATHVTLVGPPGIGRSRMLTELISTLARQEHFFVRSAAQGAALAVDTSYGLVTALLRDPFGIPEGAPLEEILHRLRRGVRWLRLRIARAGGGAAQPPSSSLLGTTRDDPSARQDLDDALIHIAGFLDTRKASPASGGATSPDEDGSQMKHRLAAALACLVRFAASLAPVVVLCDDAHWVDDASLDLLDDLVLRAEDLPVLVVCTARPDLYERRPHWGEGKATHRRVDLAPLEHRHAEAMVRDRLRRVRDLSSEFVRTVAQRADGNPFILDETLRFLVDDGVIEVPADGGAWLVRERDLEALALPATVQGIVQARLDRLDRPAHALIERAAVVGKTFWEGAVDELRRASPPLAPEPKTAEIIAALRKAQLVQVRETTTLLGERERIFAESATREVAYEMLPIQERRPLHRIVARWLRERAPDAAHAAMLARHHDLGGDALAAAEAYGRAAAHASALGLHAEALRHILRACELHDELREEAGSGQDTSKVPWQDRIRFRLDLGDVQRLLGRLDEAEASYGEARCDIPAADSEAPSWEARTDFRLSLTFKLRGETAKARVLVERAIAIAKKEESAMAGELPAMYALLAFLHRRERNHAASWQAGLEGLRACQTIRRQGDRSLQAEARALLGLAPVLFSRRRWVAAERTYRQAARLATQADDLDLLGRALNGVAAVLARGDYARGDYARARATYLESLRVKEKAGDLHQIAVAYSNVAEVELEMNEHAAAFEHARRAVRLAEQIHAESDLAEMYRNLGAAALGLRKVDAAMDACLNAVRIAERAGRVYLDGTVETLARVCARAAETAPEGAPLRARATEIQAALAAIVEQGFVDDALRERILALLTVVEPFLVGHQVGPASPA